VVVAGPRVDPAALHCLSSQVERCALPRCSPSSSQLSLVRPHDERVVLLEV
jgi:hypothetical protein